jgi:hypothetical protein
MEEVNNVTSGNHSRYQNCQTYTMNNASWNRESKCLYVDAELSSQDRQEIARIGQEIMKPIGEFSSKSQRDKDWDHRRKETEDIIFDWDKKSSAKADHGKNEQRTKDEKRRKGYKVGTQEKALY